MRIISNFKDYYDTCSAYGIDQNITYVRKTKIMDIPKELVHVKKQIEMRRKNIHYPFSLPIYGILLFCGEYFEIAKLENSVYFSFDECDKIVDEYRQENESKTGYRKNIFYRLKDKSDNELFSKKEILDLHFQYQSPILAVWYNNHKSFYSSNSLILEVNPNLQYCEFFRKIDSVTTFQEIQMFISGVLTSTKEPIPISDTIRLEKHGFDKKTSFRKTKVYERAKM